MAIAALQGTFTDPDDPDDAVLANAYFMVYDVSINRDRPAATEAIASYRVFKSLAAMNTGKKPRYQNTFPFNYAPAGGNAYNQATQALKALAMFPGLIDV